MIMSKVISPIEQLYSICNEYKSNVRLKKTKTPEYQQCIMDIFAIKEKCDEHWVKFDLEMVLLSLSGD